jgi:polysaccharide deacetylase family protein (PEP-CTERM system associated)
MTHALSFDIEDWFHMVDVTAVEDPEKWESMSSLVEKRTHEILELCAEFDVRATFFILGWIANRYPNLVRAIADAGHELASHSYWHRRVYLLTPDEFEEDLRLSMDVIEQASGQKVKGFRAPSFSITAGSEWAIDVLHKCGIEYDASLFPASRGHGGYDCPVEAHIFDKSPSGKGMPTLPMSTMRIGGQSVCYSGGGYLRLFPVWLIERGIKQLAKTGVPTVVYLHPRDFAPDCPRVPMPLHRRFKSYVGAGSTASKLKWLLESYRWSTCSSVLRQQLGGISPPEDLDASH